MNNVYLLEIDFELNGQKQTITPTILRDKENTILIDCGYPNFIPLLEEAAARHHISLDSINKIIVTHHDVDHMGSLAALKQTYPQIEIIAHELDSPYIEGKSKPLRVVQAESNFDELPDEEKTGIEQFIAFLQSVEPTSVDVMVSSGEHLPWCDGIEIVHTPGHLPGHISLYLPTSKTLIAGDAVVFEEEKLNIANPPFAWDLDEAVRSVQKLLEYDIEHLICYHGGLFHGDINKALNDLLTVYLPLNK